MNISTTTKPQSNNPPSKIHHQNENRTSRNPKCSKSKKHPSLKTTETTQTHQQYIHPKERALLWPKLGERLPWPRCVLKKDIHNEMSNTIIGFELQLKTYKSTQSIRQSHTIKSTSPHHQIDKSTQSDLQIHIMDSTNAIHNKHPPSQNLTQTCS